MAKRRVMFTFPPELITEPIIYNLGQQFHVVTNIETSHCQLAGFIFTYNGVYINDR